MIIVIFSGIVSILRCFLYSLNKTKINLADKKIIHNLSHYTSNIRVMIKLKETIFNVYNLKDLCAKIDVNSGLSLKDIITHIDRDHIRIDYENYEKQIINDYKEIIFTK